MNPLPAVVFDSESVLTIAPAHRTKPKRAAAGIRRRRWLGALAALGMALGASVAAGQLPSVKSERVALPAGDAALVVWSWRADTAERIDGVTPMVWVDFNYGQRPRRTGTTYHTARPDHEIAREVLNEINRLQNAGKLPDGHLALHLWYAGRTHGVGGEQAQPPLFPEARLPEALAQGGLVTHTRDLMRRVAQRLHLEGVEPDFLVLDYENGATTWQLGKREGKSNPVAWKRDIEQAWQLAGDTMPAALRDPAHRDELLKPWPMRRESIVAFNEWAEQRRREAVRKAVFDPWWQAYGRTIPGSNYGDQVRAWETFDANGWPEPVNDELSGTWSSPVPYLSAVSGNRVQRQVGAGLDKAGQLAAAWADQRNRVRAALAWSPDVAPWYSNPDWGRPEGFDADAWRWAWAAGLLHDRKHGVRRMLLWSGQPWTDAEVAFAQRVFAMLHGLPAEAVKHVPNLQPVPLDEADAWLAGWVQQARGAMPPAEQEAPETVDDAAKPLR